MSGFSTYLSDAILNWVKSTAFPSDPAAIYCALFDGDPLDDVSGGTEVTTTVRAAGRVAITFGAVTGKTIANSADVDFGPSDGACDVDHVAIFDASSAGNMLFSFPIVTPKSIAVSTPVKFPTGDLVVDLSTP